MTLPRFYPILDTRVLAARSLEPVEAAAAILEAGARILQFRHKDAFDRRTFETARRVAESCARYGARFVLNDRADFAALLGAAVHLGQEDLRPADARHIVGEGGGIGLSTHNEPQLRAAAAEPVDYLAFGPVFTTGSKNNPDPVTGVGELRRLRPLTVKPLVAIGGITRANAGEVLAAGADSVAVISDLYAEAVSPAAIARTVESWLRTVDAN